MKTGRADSSSFPKLSSAIGRAGVEGEAVTTNLDSIRDFYKSVVVPNVESFEANFGDMRASFNAVHAGDALSAHVYQIADEMNLLGVPPPRDDSAFRQTLSQQNEYFQLLRDVAKAQKHVVLTNYKPLITDSRETIPHQLTWDEGRWDEGRWDSPEQVCVKTNTGEYRPVKAIVRQGLSFLLSHAKAIGIPDFTR
jgi:hypothetical protein